MISNLIGNILDVRLLSLTRAARCTYTRYVDDLTFSTNETLFPTDIAINVHGSDWEVGNKLRYEIEGAGFSLNSGKTRMSLRHSRQTVTGLVVNAKVNVNQDYYRSVRTMCNAVFQKGMYCRPLNDATETTTNLNPLEGMLSHIYFVKARRDRLAKINKLAIEAEEFRQPQAFKKLCRNFLFYKYFAAPKTPLIVTEGISDITYLQCAVRSLAKKFPTLAKEEDGKIKRLVNFLKPSTTTRDVLNLGHGAAGQAELIARYTNSLKKYAHKPMDHPVIILCDNDDGPKEVFKKAQEKSKCHISLNISLETTDPFYALGENLYLVKVPEGPSLGSKEISKEIEDLFQPILLDRKIDGKPFNRKQERGNDTSYGKVIFAEKVVRPNAASIDFSGFIELLSRIDQCLIHYKTVKTDA